MFPYTLFSIYSLVICYSLLTKQAMSFQKELERWLDEATFFPSPKAAAEESQVLCLDDIVCFDGNGKAHNQSASFQFSDVADIFDDGWMDEKIDLSVFDPEQDLPLIDGSEKKASSDAYTLLDSIVDSDLLSDPVSILSSSVEIPNSSVDHLYYDPAVITVASEETATSSASMLPEMGLQLPSSPADTCSVYSRSTMSPVEVGENVSESDCSAIGLCIEIIPDVDFLCDKSAPGGKKPSGKDLSLLRQSCKVDSHPYSSVARHTKKEWRKERKKVQNKEAAARYRLKKQEESKLLADEVADLEATQAELQNKHDKLQAEVKYLKSLMREMFKARGILK